MSTRPPAARRAGRAAARKASWFEHYPASAAGGDLYTDAPRWVAHRWDAVAGELARLGEGDPAAVQDATTRNAADLGLTFRVTGDEDERAWPVNAMPLVIGAGEWEGLERGLIQRADMLERLAADIYGPQRLVKEGHLPAAVIAGSPYFVRRMIGHTPPKGRFVQVYSADLARGPRGQWRVLQDRVRLASGIGYTLENRLAMSRTTGDLLGASNVRRTAGFFEDMREGLAAACGRERPRVALLTPGRFNQTYSEQAHLARYLGLPLVEGRDLSVLDNRLYVGTIAGPKRVDGIWRWINTDRLDPLAFDARSQLGVANLYEAWASGEVGMANWPGTEVLESAALAAFMPRLCRILMGEAPLLPSIATWWCGQASEGATVGQRIDELALLPAFGQPVEGLAASQPVAGVALSGEERALFTEALRRRPMDYCGQEIVQLSTTPAIIEGKVAALPFTLRAFVARTADGGWTVMPGGFARLSSGPSRPTTMMGEGDLSADVWVVDEKPTDQHQRTTLSAEPPISRGGGILASQAADNLFWFGRYNQRGEIVLRIVRSLLGNSMEGESGPTGVGEVAAGLVRLLAFWGAAGGTAGTGAAAGNGAGALDANAVCARALSDGSLVGSVATLLRRRMEAGMSLRERFARDFWRIVSRPMPVISAGRPQEMLATSRNLGEHFSALSGLVAENMVRSSAWRFLLIGQRIERAQAICRMARELTALGPASAEVASGVLLDLCDSQIIYRTRYLTAPMPNPVRDLVLLDPDNPRALVFQVAQIVEHLSQLPSVRDDNVPEAPLRAARAILGKLQAAVAEEMDAARLEAFERELFTLSDLVSQRYFLQFDREGAERRTRLM
ncbi:circularly permuted type 2 ATP-grasp protein [Novosphingobium sp. 1949]|uniref:Circularly permuted type 2 ATP-grasp protein n=1 Tax=Novosphingobium organovorum TaxID=2930092 RepID=A0ABT0BIA9_9SPHN|nr:circularly permuted type 2 ATP-grasp protein [Novosphingobium organovorum]MCJ2184665.1 circularly permuted type 2 ATP-grasp protein [Novosphingobium organovorum]